MSKAESVILKLIGSANFWAAVAGVGGIIASAIGFSSDGIKNDIVTIGGIVITIISLFGYNLQKAAQIKATAQVESVRASREPINLGK